jgi:hypothetical protein
VVRLLLHLNISLSGSRNLLAFILQFCAQARLQELVSELYMVEILLNMEGEEVLFK